MKLYWIALSPYARKVLIVAREHGVFDRIELITTKVTPANPELMQHNPLNKVPTLLLHDGSALYDSAVICEYLDAIGNGPKLFPPTGEARWNALRRHALGSGLSDLLIAWRTDLLLPVEKHVQERFDKYALKATSILRTIESELATHRGFDIGDISMGCALGYLRLRFPELAPSASSATSQWIAQFDARPSVIATPVGA